MGVRDRVWVWVRVRVRVRVTLQSCNAIGLDTNVKFVFGRMRQLQKKVGPHAFCRVTTTDACSRIFVFLG